MYYHRTRALFTFSSWIFWANYSIVYCFCGQFCILPIIVFVKLPSLSLRNNMKLWAIYLSPFHIFIHRFNISGSIFTYYIHITITFSKSQVLLISIFKIIYIKGKHNQLRATALALLKDSVYFTQKPTFSILHHHFYKTLTSVYLFYKIFQ